MNRYMLDTNTASYILRGTMPKVREHLNQVAMDRISVSAVTEGELRHGVERLAPSGKSLKTLVDEFLLRTSILPWDSLVAQRYGYLRAALEREGRP